MIKNIKKIKISNKNLLEYLQKDAETSEKFCLLGGFWLGFETSAEYFYLQNLKNYKFFIK